MLSVDTRYDAGFQGGGSIQVMSGWKGVVVVTYGLRVRRQDQEVVWEICRS